MSGVPLRCIVLIAALCIHSSHAGARFVTASGFYAQKYADVPFPRGLFLDSSGDILVLSMETSSIFALSELTNSDETITVKQDRIVDGSGLGLSHGITHHKDYVYASSATTVYRWPYKAGSSKLVEKPPQIVISNLPSGGYLSRTLVFDSAANLYVSIGSLENVDPNSNRARILRFAISDIPAGGIDISEGKIFSDGLRNTVGFAFDGSHALWGADNGVESLNRADLAGDIHEENPAEELNKLVDGNNYGYPYCFSSYQIKGQPKGKQFGWPTFLTDGTHGDAWCQNSKNNKPPALPLPAHTAPLGIEFYNGDVCSSGKGAFPCSMKGHAFIAHHGSTNSAKRVGYQVTRVPFSGGNLTGEIMEVIYGEDKDGCDPSSTCFTPVNAIFDRGGHLIVSTDTSGEIFRVFHNTPPPPLQGSSMGSMISTIFFFVVFSFGMVLSYQVFTLLDEIGIINE